MPKRKTIIFRFELICLVLAMMFSLSAFALVRTAVHKRALYLKKCAKFAWTMHIVPSCRGSISDKDGILLAWSERYYDLYIKDTRNLEEILTQIEKRTKIKYAPVTEPSGLIKSSVPPAELKKIVSLPSDILAKLDIKIRFKRNYVEYEEVKKIIGTIPYENSLGSGIEAFYDSSLRGQDGIFVVMLDRNKRKLSKTLRWEQEYRSGENIKLSLSLEEIKNGKIPYELENIKNF